MASMRIGRFQNSKRVFSFILVILCCGMLFAETHGLLGHTRSIPAGASKSEFTALCSQQSIEFLALGLEKDAHSCSVCYCYTLLGQSLVPPIHRILDSSFSIQPILVCRICLIQTRALKTENRGPPQAWFHRSRA
jgi:hypothetical protein